MPKSFGMAPVVLAILFLLAGSARALDRPWISDTFFYWYTWDYERELGGWMGGVYNTPLYGYYESRSYKDNYFQLRLASEWGITHHFMDYWAPNWKDLEGKPREALLMRASEQLRREGYDIWMSYYQDGSDFQMDEFVKNMEPGRDVYLALKDYAGSVCWPRVRGRPFHLVYGRNGVPAPREDNEDFRRFLKQKYPTLQALNEAWGKEFKSWDGVELDFSRGIPRADSIRYQYDAWRRGWEALEERVRDEFGFPGLAVSFDIGYRPFRGYGFSNYVRLFNGPHSYGGIFGQPQDLDTDRFINAAVAKWYDTVFLDHFKNFYHDWEIRIPGIRYAPEPLHFDRFWAGTLMRYSEALVHLSWNEWWEGSNLEPCWEYGKTYCEKNLFWSTLMQSAFPSIKDYSKGAQAAVLLNDWQWAVGSRRTDDLYGTIEKLRELTVPFALIPDDFVTTEELSKYRLVIAPAAGVGFGENAAGRPIGEVLQEWVRGGDERFLVVSAYDALKAPLGLKPYVPRRAAAAVKGEDINVFVDVGVEGDEKFLIEGASGRENWGKLSEDSFGASNVDYTVRWTPAMGNQTTFVLPCSPGRDHVLRLAGTGFADNEAEVVVNGKAAGSFKIKGETREDFELKIAADVIGSAEVAYLSIVYKKANIPGKIDPERFPSEGRVCNLGIDWLQFATWGTPLTRENRYEPPTSSLSFEGKVFEALAEREVEVPICLHEAIASDQARVISRYTADGAPHIMLFEKTGRLALVNGDVGAVPAPALEALAGGWAGVNPPHNIRGENVKGAVLEAGRTLLALAYNYDIAEPRKVSFSIDVGESSVADVTALSRDGKASEPVEFRVRDGKVVFEDEVGFYGVYQMVRCPVRLKAEPIVMQPGQSLNVEVELENTSQRAVSGRLALGAVIPTIQSDPAPFDLPAGARRKVALAVRVSKSADWGRKTVGLEIEWEGKRAYWFRELLLERNPDLELATPTVTSRNPAFTIVNTEHPWISTAPAKKIRFKVEHAVLVDDASAERIVDRLHSKRDKPRVTARQLVVSYDCCGETMQKRIPFAFADLPEAPKARPTDAPADAVARVFVTNGSGRSRESALVELDLRRIGLPAKTLGGSLFVREEGGNPIASQKGGADRLYFVAKAPASAVASYWLCAGVPPDAPSAMAYDCAELGTGNGRIRINTGRLSLELDEARGGTVTSLVSMRSGLEYATGSFGAAYGRFSKHDPKKPTDNTVSFIQEEKVSQRDRAGRLRIVESGPARLVVRNHWSDKNLLATQTYTFWADSAAFDVECRVKYVGEELPQEVVLLDARFNHNDVTKIFPNFTGIHTGPNEQKPHFGWREVRYIPPYATMMKPDAFLESVSFILLDGRRVNWFRQGLWTEKRPEEGARRYARIEYACRREREAEVCVRVLIHPGHQLIAKHAVQDLNDPPVVTVDVLPGEARAAGGSGAGRIDPPWWDGHWHWRAPIIIASPPNPGAELVADVDLSALGAEGVDVSSLVVVCHRSERRACPVKTAFVQAKPGAANGQLQWKVPPGVREGARFLLYFDSRDYPKPTAKRPGVQVSAAKLLDGSFEESPSCWSFSNSRPETGQGRTGKTCARLELTGVEGISLITNASMRVRPENKYALTFCAKTDCAVDVRANLYSGAGYDFPQFGVRMKPDGQWHEYRLELPTGRFPASVRPGLRLWLINQKGWVLIDDVNLEALGEGAPQADSFKLGKAERY